MRVFPAQSMFESTRGRLSWNEVYLRFQTDCLLQSTMNLAILLVRARYARSCCCLAACVSVCLCLVHYSDRGWFGSNYCIQKMGRACFLGVFLRKKWGESWKPQAKICLQRVTGHWSPYQRGGLFDRATNASAHGRKRVSIVSRCPQKSAKTSTDKGQVTLCSLYW